MCDEFAWKEKHDKYFMTTTTTTLSLSLYQVQPVAAGCIIGWDAAMPLMQCPPYKYTGAYFADFGRMTDRVNLLVYFVIQRPTGLELRTLGSKAATLTTKPTPGLILSDNTDDIPSPQDLDNL